MVDFVDLHCHTLFRVDDGARTEEMMQSMLDIAYNDRIRYICFSPHFKIYEFYSEEEMYEQMKRLNRRFEAARKYVCEKYPDMKLFLGNEIMYHSDIYGSLSSKKCHFLGNSSFALIEFAPSATSYEIENTVSQLLRKGVKPLIAHIERYSALIKEPELLRTLKESGALFQVNAKSVLSFKLGKTARFLKSALKNQLVDVVASDAHNDTSFPPVLSKAYNSVAKFYGSVYADKIFHHTPLAILMNEKIF